MKVKVLYNVEETDGIDMEFDKEISSFLKSKGFEMTGCGTDLHSRERDLCFEKKEVLV
jgi:hypothetical protein